MSTWGMRWVKAKGKKGVKGRAGRSKSPQKAWHLVLLCCCLLISLPRTDPMSMTEDREWTSDHLLGSRLLAPGQRGGRRCGGTGCHSQQPSPKLGLKDWLSHSYAV